MTIGLTSERIGKVSDKRLNWRHLAQPLVKVTALDTPTGKQKRRLGFLRAQILSFGRL
jgi:hypothetical protein